MEVIKMARTKAGDFTPYQKLLTLMQEGDVVTKDEIESKLGNDIYIYKLSTYAWEVKTKTPGILKVIKNGRTVVGYQIINPDVVKAYLKSCGADKFVPGQTTLKPSVSKFAVKPVKSLAALKAKPAKTKAAKPAKVEAPAAPVIEDEVVEITE
jgi:hypothetical protein